jgi:hypothetical protein
MRAVGAAPEVSRTSWHGIFDSGDERSLPQPEHRPHGPVHVSVILDRIWWRLILLRETQRAPQ